MSGSFKKNEYLRMFQSLHHNKIKFQIPLILKMYGALNKINMRNENRYILCNFLDQHSDEIGLDEDIYKTFCEAYLEHGRNARKAAEIAGYAVKTSHNIGNALFFYER